MKHNLKNNVGITLMSLAIAIIVLSIIVGMTTFSLNDAMQSSKLSAFTTELKLMQTQVNTLYEKMKNNEEVNVNGTVYIGTGDKEKDILGIQDIGEDLKDEKLTQANVAFDATQIPDKERSGFKYYSADLMKNGLGIDGIKQDLLVNIQNRTVLSYNGLSYKGNMYYDLSELPDGQYNVKHEESTAEVPDFEATIVEGDNGGWNVTVYNIQYEGYIEKWQVKYKLEESDIWKTSDSLEFSITNPGDYVIKIVNGDVESEEQYFTIDEPYAEFSTSDENTASPEADSEETSGPSIEDSSFEISDENSQSDIRD